MKFWPALFICLLMTGCAAKKWDTRISYDNSTRVALEQQANNGDADAQFQLGNSYCCGDGGFYDTAQAVTWWCKAAAQGHAGAKDRLTERKAGCPAPESVIH
jgi:TPR repeat protein